MSTTAPQLQQAASTGVKQDQSKRQLLLTMFVILICLSLWSPPNFADNSCNREIRVNNMLGNALFTLIFRSANGEVKNWGDVGESLTYGATAGYLFHKSREMIGQGDESRGMATAYLASSISENASHGLHPLAYLRYGVGPMEVKWRTPWAGGGNHLSFNINAIDAMGMLSLMASGGAGNFKLRNGIMTGEDFGAIDPEFSGYSLNRTVVLRAEDAHDQGLWHHEMIHTTQYLQYSSFGSEGFDVVDWEKVDRFGIRDSVAQTGIDMNLRVEWFNSVINSMDHQNEYQFRSREVEAARIAQNTSPMHDDHDHTCSAEVGFQFKF